MNSLFTVIGFTFKNKIKSKSFIVTSIIILVLLSVVINLPYMIQSFSSDEPKQVGMFEDSSEITEMLRFYVDQQEEKDFELIFMTPLGSPEQNNKWIKEEIANGNVDGFLELHEGPQGSFPAVVYKSESSLDFSIKSVLRNTLSTIKRN